MLKKLAAMLTVSVSLVALTVPNSPAFAARGGHRGGFGGSAHFAGGHFGGGAHFAGGHFGGGRHFAMGHFAAPHFGGGHWHFTTHHFAGHAVHRGRIAAFSYRRHGHVASLRDHHPAVGPHGHNARMANLHGHHGATPGLHSHLGATAGPHQPHHETNFANGSLVHAGGGKRFAANHLADRHRNRFWNARFASHAAPWWHHHRHEWRHGWFGPVFWPFVYGDIFSYALWPYDYYDEPFWDYGPDLVLDSVYYPYDVYGGYETGNAYAGYEGAYANVYGVAPSRRSRATAAVAPLNIPSEQVAQTCSGLAPGVTDLPLQKLRKLLHLTGDEQTALDDLKTASAKAQDLLRQSCPSTPPATPVARLDAVQKRLQAVEAAAAVIRAPLEKFYDLLTPAQKQSLMAAAPARRGVSQASKGGNNLPCSGNAGFTSVPVQQIEQTIHLDNAQQADLDQLRMASADAAKAIKDSCPSTAPATPSAALQAVESRVSALLQAVNKVRPALNAFYASLTDSQKSALNSLGRSNSMTASNNRE